MSDTHLSIGKKLLKLPKRVQMVLFGITLVLFNAIFLFVPPSHLPEPTPPELEPYVWLIIGVFFLYFMYIDFIILGKILDSIQKKTGWRGFRIKIVFTKPIPKQ